VAATPTIRSEHREYPEAAHDDNCIDHRPLGVYVHWPFCLSKCPIATSTAMCACRDRRGALHSRLRGEIQNDRSRIPGYRLHHLLRRRTPLMQPPTVGGYSSHNRQALVDGRGRCEVTLEHQPASEASAFRGYRSAGVTGVSLGVQALDDASSGACECIPHQDGVPRRRDGGDGTPGIRAAVVWNLAAKARM